MREGSPCFRLEGVTVVRAGRQVLRVPRLSIDAGKTTAVLGPSGAGKTTLLRLLALLDPPDCGNVVARGPEGAPLRPGRVVMMFQRPALLRGTVFDNAAVGLRLRGERVSPGQVLPLLERVGLHEKVRQPVRTLSGGEYQRVALARALLLKPAALLLDEPTANLDPQNVALIESLVRQDQAERGTTVVWVTHNPAQAARVADRALLLLDGEVAEHSETGVFFSEAASPPARAFLRGELVW